MSDTEPALSPVEITSPSPTEKRYDMRVLVPHLKANARYTTHPWLRITANSQTEAIMLAAGISVRRREEDDGA